MMLVSAPYRHVSACNTDDQRRIASLTKPIHQKSDARRGRGRQLERAILVCKKPNTECAGKPHHTTATPFKEGGRGIFGMAPLRLYVWGPAFGLASLDAECLAAIAFLARTLSSAEYRLIRSSPSAVPTRTVPPCPVS
jgi:hypothetical protein